MPLRRHQRTGIGSSNGNSLPRARSRTPSVAIAVGSGAMPKTSDEAQPRPCSGASNGCPASAKPRMRYPVQPASPRRSKARPSRKRHDDEQRAFNGESRRDIGGSPVDGRVAIPQEGPPDEDPKDREDECEPACPGSRPPRDEQDDDEAGGERQHVQRPERRIVQFEHAPVDARRKQQEILRPVGPPLRHQSAFTWAEMRCRMARSGMGRRRPRGFHARGRRGWSPELRR